MKTRTSREARIGIVSGPFTVNKQYIRDLAHDANKLEDEVLKLRQQLAAITSDEAAGISAEAKDAAHTLDNVQANLMDREQHERDRADKLQDRIAHLVGLLLSIKSRLYSADHGELICCIDAAIEGKVS